MAKRRTMSTSKHNSRCPSGGPFKTNGKLRKGWRYSKRGGKPIHSKRCR